VGLLNGNVTGPDQVAEKYGTLINPRTLRQASDWPIGKKTRVLFGIVQMGKVERFEQLRFPSPFTVSNPENLQDHILSLCARHGLFLPSQITFVYFNLARWISQASEQCFLS
jgi:hypothetical protein